MFNLQKFVLLGVLTILAGGLVRCASSEPSNTYHKSDDTKPIVDDKYRLSADREKFAEVRTQIPADKQLENDEIAFTLQLMDDPSQEPSRVREKFDAALVKKREKFSKDMQKERDEFSKKEHKGREDFLKSLADFRKEFLKSKHSKEERDEFFNQQDEQRKSYLEVLKEKRSDFESDVTGRRKDFDDYARDKASDFRQQFTGFQHRHEDYLKEKEKKKKEMADAKNPGSAPASSPKAATEPVPEVKSFLQEFMDIPNSPGTHLESGD